MHASSRNPKLSIVESNFFLTLLNANLIFETLAGVRQSFKLFEITKIPPNLATEPNPRLLEEKLISLLQSCKNSNNIQQIQCLITTQGLQSKERIFSRLITTCAELKKMGHARQVLDQIPDPNVSHYNAMFKVYVQNELYNEVMILFYNMMSMDVRPNFFTLPMVLKSCVKLLAIEEGEEVHCVALKLGFKSNLFVSATLIDMYSTKGMIGSAYRVFGEMFVKNVVIWTSMINAYLLCNDVVSARRLFDLAPERDLVLWNIMITGYIDCGDMAAARQLFDVLPNRDLMSWNTLLNGYAKNGDMKGVQEVFDGMPERNIFSWNALIGGYAHNRRFSEVLAAFRRMLNEPDVCPNDVTLVNVLSACSRLGALDLGKWVHLYAENNGYQGNNVYVGNGLIDMYAKCGMIETAIDVFRRIKSKDLISWNTIINGLAVHGHGTDAVSLFFEMKNARVRPDEITFVGLLCACSHMGLVQDGFSYFRLMIDEYSIVPKIEHYGCMVDLMARAGLLEEAVDFVREMPMKADSVIWTALIGGCRIHKNIELAELALHRLIELDPKNPGNYVMLANVYGVAHKWEGVAEFKVAMRDTGCRKLPGRSWIEVDDEVAEFYSFDESHWRTEEIYGALAGLTELSKIESKQNMFNLGDFTH